MDLSSNCIRLPVKFLPPRTALLSYSDVYSSGYDAFLHQILGAVAFVTFMPSPGLMPLML